MLNECPNPKSQRSQKYFSQRPDRILVAAVVAYIVQRALLEVLILRRRSSRMSWLWNRFR